MRGTRVKELKALFVALNGRIPNGAAIETITTYRKVSKERMIGNPTAKDYVEVPQDIVKTPSEWRHWKRFAKGKTYDKGWRGSMLARRQQQSKALGATV